MENNITILQGSSEAEKAAYLGVIASLATADRQASEDELSYINALCDAADLPPQQRENVMQAANDAAGAELTQNLNVLKNSDLKYSLITDLIAFAKADTDFSEEERQNIQKIAQYLQVNQQQFSLLNEFADKAGESNAEPEQIASPNFLAATGLQNKMQQSGINTGGLLKGLVSIAGPLILSRMLGRRSGGGLGGALTGGLGGGLGGSLNPFGRRSGMGGGLGSLISMLNGGRSMSGAGGMLGRILKGF